jgi:hypothetical protein
VHACREVTQLWLLFNEKAFRRNIEKYKAWEKFLKICCNEEWPGCGFKGNHEYKFMMVRT